MKIAENKIINYLIFAFYQSVQNIRFCQISRNQAKV
jgi:hypothetical protein